jgi:Protein of unknown function (DUF1488)
MAAAAFFHEASDCVRFWTLIGADEIGATISRATLHYRFRPEAQGEDPLDTYRAHASVIEAAVRRRVAAGSREPVMLREHDLRTDPARL